MMMDPLTGGVLGLIGLVLLVIYYVLLVRVILEMLRLNGNPVLLVFSCLALIPVPPSFILGILMMVIWHKHAKTMPDTV